MALGATAAQTIVTAAVLSDSKFVGSYINSLAQDGSSPYVDLNSDTTGALLTIDVQMRRMGMSIGQCNAVVAAVAASPLNPWIQGMPTATKVSLLSNFVGRMQAAAVLRTSGQTNTTSLIVWSPDGGVTRQIASGDLIAWLGANVT